MHEKLLDELNESLKALTPKSIALGAWYQFEQVWNYPYHERRKGADHGRDVDPWH